MTEEELINAAQEAVASKFASLMDSSDGITKAAGKMMELGSGALMLNTMKWCRDNKVSMGQYHRAIFRMAVANFRASMTMNNVPALDKLIIIDEIVHFIHKEMHDLMQEVVESMPDTAPKE